MRIKQEEFDKLTDIEKIKINSYLGAAMQPGLSAIVIGAVFLGFALHNMLLTNLFSSLLFFLIGAIITFIGMTKGSIPLKKIEEKYFEIKLKKNK